MVFVGMRKIPIGGKISEMYRKSQEEEYHEKLSNREIDPREVIQKFERRCLLRKLFASPDAEFQYYTAKRFIEEQNSKGYKVTDCLR